ncbi:MAG TPA: PilZ domain-containing protein [Thermodesulfobacteriota bacterium]|nr:PilZ domain-containing protein [Thermodesulfobacteriota bacterium]
MESMEKSLASVASEKRKHPRFNVDLPIKYGRTQLFSKYARAVNASQGGLLLSLPEEVDIGQHLALKLFFPSQSELNTIDAAVQVVWTDLHMRKDWSWDYQTGVRFVGIRTEDTAFLKNFLVTLEPKSPVTA